MYAKIHTVEIGFSIQYAYDDTGLHQSSSSWDIAVQYMLTVDDNSFDFILEKAGVNLMIPKLDINAPETWQHRSDLEQFRMKCPST